MSPFVKHVLDLLAKVGTLRAETELTGQVQLIGRLLPLPPSGMLCSCQIESGGDGAASVGISRQDFSRGFLQCLGLGYARVSEGINASGEIFALLLPPEVASLHRSVSGTVTIDFVGNPGRIYQIEAANDLHLSEAWELAGARQADQVGRFQFEESSNSDSRFYRAVSP